MRVEAVFCAVGFDIISAMEMPEYEIGRTVFGSAAEIAAAYDVFRKQTIDETRLAPTREDPFGGVRRGLKDEASITDVATFDGREESTLTFAPSTKPGWWIRRCDLPEQLDTEVDISNLWSSAQNLVLRSGSHRNYLRMVEHIIALKVGLGLDDCLLKVQSGDPPLFDDSSLPLVKTVEKCGIVDSEEVRGKSEEISEEVRGKSEELRSGDYINKNETSATLHSSLFTLHSPNYVTVKEPVAFGGKRGDFLLFLPAKDGERNLRIDCAIKWNTCIGLQRILFDVTPETFTYASLARTNCTRNQYFAALTIGKLFAATRHWGYTKKNILIHGKHGWHNEPRFPVGDKFLEPVWHRATLDLMAAIALIRGRFVGTVVSYRAGHTMDCDAVRALYRNDLLTMLK